MKKVMFAAAVAAGMLAFGDAIESQNVVGFLNHNVADTVKAMRGQLFQMPAGGSYNLQDLIPYNGAEICQGGEFDIWWWNTDTSWGDKTRGNKYATWSDLYLAENAEDTANEAYYYDDESSTGFVFEQCWTTTDFPPVKYRGTMNKTFAAGEGFFVQPSCANPKLTIAGEVLGSADTTHEYRKVAYVDTQKQLAVSPFPVPVNLQAIVPMSGNTVCQGGEFDIWWWNTDTSWGDKTRGNKYATWSDLYLAENAEDTANEAYYYDDESSTGFVFEQCWTTTDFPPVKYRGTMDKTFAAGEGFYVQPSCSTPYLAFPNPFYVAP